MARREVIEYVQRLKGQFPDEDIRRQLLNDGVSLDEIDDAFRIASVMAAPAAPAAPPWPSRIAIVFFIVVVMTLVLSAVLRKASRIGGSDSPKQACEMNDDQKAAVDADVRRHSPAPYAYPSNVDAFLPSDLEEGDASGPMLAAVKAALEAGGPALVEGLATDGYRLPPAVAAQARAKLEEGLRFGDNLMTGVSLVPRSYAETGSMAVVPVILARLGDPYLDRAEAYYKESKLADAEGEAKKVIALGFLLMKDWSTVSRAMGLAVILDGYAVVRRVQEKAIEAEAGLDCVVRKMEVAKVTGMLGKELKGFMMQPEETEAIGKLAKAPAELAGLQKYLDSPTLRQVYAGHALLGVIEAWSPEEILSGKPHPNRGKFLDAAAKHKDPRLAALAGGFSQAFNELVSLYAKLSPDERRLAAAGKPVPSSAAYVPATAQDRHRLLLDMASRK
ncbi:MAG: hypothetical protein HY748_15250 [Elusimicrobia bacterium]|nr:hypothetical protein [Elusimicrobiota bacterium]